MNYLLYDDPAIKISLLPLTFTRPVAKIRIGIYTIAEKWEYFLNTSIFYSTSAILQEKFSPLLPEGKCIFINGAVCPTKELIDEILNLQKGEVLVKGQIVIAYFDQPIGRQKVFSNTLTIIEHLWDIFTFNSLEIRSDFKIISDQRKSHAITDEHTRIYNSENIFIEEGATIRAAIINAEAGPVYIGKNAVVNEGVIIKGPFSLGEESHLTMGAKMRGDSTIGPFSKVGGEVSNSVIFGYSNKGHDGFMGNTIIGEWCNLGADTNTSNLKNNYGEIELYNFSEHKLVKTGKQFCGLIMGDHSKCGINTMFNTGTVVGVSSNIFGSGFPQKYVPSFSWGGGNDFQTFELEKSFQVAEAMMARRNFKFNDIDKKIFTEIFNNRENN